MTWLRRPNEYSGTERDCIYREGKSSIGFDTLTRDCTNSGATIGVPFYGSCASIFADALLPDSCGPAFSCSAQYAIGPRECGTGRTRFESRLLGHRSRLAHNWQGAVRAKRRQAFHSRLEYQIVHDSRSAGFNWAGLYLSHHGRNQWYRGQIWPLDRGSALGRARRSESLGTGVTVHSTNRAQRSSD